MPTGPPISDETRIEYDETLDDWVEQRVVELSRLYTEVAAGRNPLTFIPTGLERLDGAGLWEPGVLHAIIGHEGDGKTTLLVQTAEAAARAGHRVQLYIPEDPREMIADRVLAPLLDVAAFDIRRLKAPNPAGLPKRLEAARAAIGKWSTNITVDDQRYDSKVIIEQMYDRYADEKTALVGMDYVQLLGAESDEKSVERVIANFIRLFNAFCKNPTRSRSKGNTPTDKVAGIALSQVGSHVKRRGIERFNDCRRNAYFRKKDDPDGEQDRPSTEWIEGFRPLPGDAQWAPTALGQQSRVVLSILRPNDILTTMGVAGLNDDIMEILPIKNNYSRKPKMIRLKWDGSRARLSDPRKAE